MNEHILIVEDEQELCLTLGDRLRSEGYAVECAFDGKSGMDKIREAPFDLVILDLMLPVRSGLDLCVDIRRSGFTTPILILTALGQSVEKVAGLKLGADDYVTKPFGIEELLARVRASLRRHSSAEAIPAFQSKELSVDFESRRVTALGEEVHLAPKEFEVLKHLIAQQGRPVSHRRLLQSVWGPQYGEETENLRVVINQLRKKIEKDPAQPKFILTEPWVGYRFQPAKAAAKSSGKGSK